MSKYFLKVLVCFPSLMRIQADRQASARSGEQVSHTNRQINSAVFATGSGEVIESFEILPASRLSFPSCTASCIPEGYLPTCQRKLATGDNPIYLSICSVCPLPVGYRSHRRTDWAGIGGVFGYLGVFGIFEGWAWIHTDPRAHT